MVLMHGSESLSNSFKFFKANKSQLGLPLIIMKDKEVVTSLKGLEFMKADS